MPTNTPFSEFSYTITETDPDEYNMRLARLTLQHNNKTVINQLFNSTQEVGCYRDWETDRKSTRLNSSHSAKSRMPSSA